MSVTFDTNLLLGWFQAKSSLAAAQVGGSGSATAATAAKVPVAPWNRGPRGVPADSALLNSALSGDPFVKDKTVKLSVPNADPDYTKLFALNQGLSALQAVATAANDPKVSAFKLTQLQSAFQRGLAEISSYVEAAKFNQFRLTSGTPLASDASTAGVPQAQDAYVTATLATGSSGAPVAAFQGNVQFDAVVTLSAATRSAPAKTTNVHFDLAEMGAAPRSMTAVAKYLNDKLKAAGTAIRVDVNRTQAPDETINVNGKPVTIAAGQPQLALAFHGLSAQAVTFSAPVTNAAVYIAQTAGSTDPTIKGSGQQQELLKLETGSGADGVRRPGDANYVSGRVFSGKLPDGVSQVHATATGPDGSVYLVADATSAVNGQGLKGAQDAVLLKYDAAGKLAYTQTLGAGVSATGLAVTVAADGKVAIAGSVTGVLDGNSGADPKVADSFVTVFDAQGNELWTQRQGATGADEAQAVAFDAAGNVYVAGRTKGSIGGGTPVGGWDGYLRAYSAKGVSQGTTQFGSTADDKVSGLLVNGTTIYVAGQDGANGMVRSFDITNPKQMALTGARNLGGLGGGSIGGIGIDGSGHLLIGGSAAANLNVGNVTLAHAGGLDGFGARIAMNLADTSADAIAYYGGSGADRATAATIAGGQVWLTGTTKTDLPGLAPVGKQDGFVAALNVGAGAVTYSKRFTAKDQTDAPQAIAVDVSGGSALDLLGLPKGSIGQAQVPGGVAPDPASVALLTTSTALRAGDQFQIRVGSSPATTITIAADETLGSLKSKIQRAGRFEINVTTPGTGKTETLSLAPADDRHTFEILSGPSGRDALAALGLKPGLIRNTTVDKTKGVVPADKGTQTYGLRFSSKLDLNSPADIKTALDAVGNAITTVRAIYADLKQAATPKKPPTGDAGQASAYMQTKIADYQQALLRLTGGQPSGGGSTDPIVSILG